MFKAIILSAAFFAVAAPAYAGDTLAFPMSNGTMKYVETPAMVSLHDKSGQRIYYGVGVGQQGTATGGPAGGYPGVVRA